MLLFALAALGHAPTFEFQTLQGEPSQAMYLTAPHQIEIAFATNDYIYAAVMVPSDSHDVAVHSPRCVLGPPGTHAHHANFTPGHVFHEPFSESSLRTVQTVWYGNKSGADQTCSFVVSGSGPYVVATGTEEQFGMVYVYGIPYFVARVSIWSGSVVFYVVAGLLVALTAGAGLGTRRLDPTLVVGILLSLLAAVVMRASQALRYDQATWSLLFVLPPLLLMAVVLVATNHRWLCLVLIITTPTRSWVDVLLATCWVGAAHLSDRVGV